MMPNGAFSDYVWLQAWFYGKNLAHALSPAWVRFQSTIGQPKPDDLVIGIWKKPAMYALLLWKNFATKFFCLCQYFIIAPGNKDIPIASVSFIFPYYN